jgi:hypothetical protein
MMGGGDPFFAYYNFLHTKKVREKEEFWKNLRKRVSLFRLFFAKNINKITSSPKFRTLKKLEIFSTVHLRTNLDRKKMEHRRKQHKKRKAHKKISF